MITHDHLFFATRDAAHAWAEYMLEEYGVTSTVWYQRGPDRFGRDSIFYVRRTGDEEMLDLWKANQVDTVYYNGTTR